jgi:hypothetical protein
MRRLSLASISWFGASTPRQWSCMRLPHDVGRPRAKRLPRRAVSHLVARVEEELETEVEYSLSRPVFFLAGLST